MNFPGLQRLVALRRVGGEDKPRVGGGGGGGGGAVGGGWGNILVEITLELGGRRRSQTDTPRRRWTGCGGRRRERR